MCYAFDENQDGAYSLEEAYKYVREEKCGSFNGTLEEFKPRFAAFDKNGDGKLTGEEIDEKK